MITISKALINAQILGLDRLDAQLLLLHALRKPDTDRAWLLAHDQDLLDATTADELKAFSQRRAAGEPLAYIVGYKEFFGLRFNMDSRVLVPRPDTETLVQWALDRVQGSNGAEILDLGTGSGAVAIAIAHHLKCKVTATDFSADALAVATQNARQLNADVQFINSDWFEKVNAHHHLIVSNPPYIADHDPHLAALMNEPLSALTAGVDGLDDIRQIIRNAPNHLHPGGWLLLEHGYDQAGVVCKLLAQRGFVQVQSRTDLAGIARCSGGRWDNQGIDFLKDKTMDETQTRIDQIVKSSDVVLFMKGNPNFPQCGFSGKAIAVLKACGVPKPMTVNVLEDGEIRQGIKEYSNWPTIPQLYVKGEFVGGSDIMMEMYESGELQQMLSAPAV